jgi:hypothetical protein
LTIRTVDHDPKTSTQTKGDLINRITLPNQNPHSARWQSKGGLPQHKAAYCPSHYLGTVASPYLLGLACTPVWRYAWLILINTATFDNQDWSNQPY